MNLEMFYEVYFQLIMDSWGCTLSESAGLTLITCEHFEKFKMVSKIAAILVIQS